jgi:hypothetical protein
MAYDQGLANRIRGVLEGTPGLKEKKMFGGLAFTVNGHIAASAYRDGRLMITCRQDDFADFQAEAGAAPMMRGGKAIAGWVLVDAERVANEEALSLWVGRGLANCLTKPPKN